MAWSPGLLLWLTVVSVGTVGHSTGATVEDQLVTVDLTNKNLFAIPSNSGQNITKMDLRNNSIELSVADCSALANYSSLTELHLDNNLIQTIRGKCFSVLPLLKVLSLSSNNISRVDPEAFSGLDELTELDLSHNLMTALPTDVFRGLTNLQVLSLRANSLEALDNRTFVDLKRLRSVDLQENPWNCSCQPLQPLNRLITLQVQIAGPRALCASPEDGAARTILQASADCNPEPLVVPPQTTTNPTLPSTTTGIPLPTSSASRPTAQPTSPNQPTTHSTTVVMMTHSTSMSNKAPAVGSDSGSSSIPVLGNTWKLLMGVLAITMCTSTVIVCAIKSPSWYKLLFNYRHQRLREDDEPHIFTTAGRYSNYSLDTQQTEASAYELEVSSQNGDEEDEDGYIEDRYIDTADYRASGGKYSSAATAEDIS